MDIYALFKVSDDDVAIDSIWTDLKQMNDYMMANSFIGCELYKVMPNEPESWEAHFNACVKIQTLTHENMIGIFNKNEYSSKIWASDQQFGIMIGNCKDLVYDIEGKLVSKTTVQPLDTVMFVGASEASINNVASKFFAELSYDRDKKIYSINSKRLLELSIELRESR